MGYTHHYYVEREYCADASGKAASDFGMLEMWGGGMRQKDPAVGRKQQELGSNRSRQSLLRMADIENDVESAFLPIKGRFEAGIAVVK